MTLGRAVLISGARQVGPALSGNPAVALTAGLALLALPVVAALGGRRLGPDLAPSLADPAVALGLTGALGVAVLVVCAAIAAAAPTLSDLDAQLLCSPVSRRSLFLALVAVPVLGPVVVIMGLFVCLLIPFAASATSPVAAVCGLLVLVAGCAATGAGLALGSVAAWQRDPAGAGVVALLAGAWFIVGIPGPTPVLAGQFGLAAQIVAGPPGWPAAAVALVACAYAGAAGWSGSAGGRPRVGRAGRRCPRSA